MKKMQGFTILFMLVLMTAFAGIAGIYLCTATFLRQLSYERQKQEYQYWAFYGLEQYARALVSGKKEVEREVIMLPHWPRAESVYQGKIEIEDGQQGNRITVQLCKDGSVVQEQKFFK